MRPTFADAVRFFESFDAPLEPQRSSHWSGPFELPSSVAEMYEVLGPRDVAVPGYGNEYFIPCLARLWNHQVGYRSDGLTGERLPGWPDQLLVVADEGGNPIAIDRATQEVSFALHGSGDWKFEPLTDSLAELMIGLGALGSVEHSVVPDLCDDDSLVLPQHVDAAVLLMTELVGPVVADRLVRWADWKLD